ncbi:hypothetical protein ANCCEY_10087 [Ancylostoma ceylanicum]|uniref:G-protein coupled receptors family 1 profile domain-containing protein n=1 Tax=Ancylostoma ceylanicum TaxID=53326 RepID=A0A0D6LI32_9BILA|nr:hypothetical protein ANCCEY_10087 [Ancylostoma ceylanicum]
MSSPWTEQLLDIVRCWHLSGQHIEGGLIPNKWAFAYVTLGPASFFGSQVSYIAYCVQLHALFYTFLSYPLSFGFRYHVLIRPMPTIRNCILLCFALWLIAFAQHILFIFSETDAHFIREYLSINKPQYNLTEFVISGNHMIKSPLTVITLASIVLPMFPIYVLVIYFYKKVHGYLAVNTRNMREGTIKGHRRLMQFLSSGKPDGYSILRETIQLSCSPTTWHSYKGIRRFNERSDWYAFYDQITTDESTRSDDAYECEQGHKHDLLR